MRGTARQHQYWHLAFGITPAHAGNRHARHRILKWTGDHPRTCGEQLISLASSGLLLGSPPHMRGTARLASAHQANFRITPAHAGNSIDIFLILEYNERITPAHAGNRLKRSCISVLLGFIIYFFHSVYNRPDRRFHNPTKPCVPPDTIFQNAVTSLATCSFPYDEAFSWLVLRYQLSYL